MNIINVLLYKHPKKYPKKYPKKKTKIPPQINYYKE